MENFLIKLLIMSASIYFVGRFSNLYEIKNFTTAIGAAFVLGIVNAIVRPILIFFTFPITFLTLGLFILVINGICLSLTASFFKGLKTKGCISSTIGYIIISLVSLLLNNLIL